MIATAIIRREARRTHPVVLLPWRIAVGLLACFALPACDDLTSLEQEAPSRILARDLEKPQNATLLVDGAIGDFECALASYIVAGGLVGDELIDAQLSQAVWDFDRRTIFPATTAYSTTACGSTQAPGVYTPLSVARFQADRSLRALQRWTDAEVPDRMRLTATAAAYAGYSLVLLGEGMCSAAIDIGPELTRVQLFQEAENRFGSALEAATDQMPVLHLARLGRARARLNLGRLADAATDAALIPDNFSFNATYSSPPFRRENLVHTHTHRGNFSSVDPSFRNVTFAGVPDPRVHVVDSRLVGHDTRTPIFRPTKYPAVNTPIPIARWAEAQLILAEAALQVGDTQGAINIINELHRRASIPPFGGRSAAEVRTQLLEERRRELFLEGHRLGDIIRNDLVLVPPAGMPFPKGGRYGDQVCFPLPDVERNNNPNLRG